MSCQGNVLLAIAVTFLGASLMTPDLADIVKQQTAFIITTAKDTQKQALEEQKQAAKALEAANEAGQQAEAAKKKYEQLSQSCKK